MRILPPHVPYRRRTPEHMGILVTEVDLAHIQSMYTYLDLVPLDVQQEQLLVRYMKGQPLKDAADNVGMPMTKARQLMDDERTHRILWYFREKMSEDIAMTRDRLGAMFLEQYHRADSATEAINAAKELGKLYDLYSDQRANRDAKKGATGVTVNINGSMPGETQVTMKQIHQLPDEELFKLAGLKRSDILPPDPIDHAPDDEYPEAEDAQFEPVLLPETSTRARTVDQRLRTAFDDPNAGVDTEAVEDATADDAGSSTHSLARTEPSQQDTP